MTFVSGGFIFIAEVVPESVDVVDAWCWLGCLLCGFFSLLREVTDLFIWLSKLNAFYLKAKKAYRKGNCFFNRLSVWDHQHQGLFLEIHTKTKLDVWLFNQKLSSWKPLSRLSTLIIIIMIIMIIMIIKQSFELQLIIKQQTTERRTFCFTWWWLSFICILDYHCALLSSQSLVWSKSSRVPQNIEVGGYFVCC